MARGKIQMKRIENATSRQVTFCKRRNGLLKKAHELYVLCDAEVAIIIFSHNGRLYEFSSSNNMQKTIERYRKCMNEAQTNMTDMGRYVQQLRLEAESTAKKIEFLEVSRRKLLGQSLGSCSMEELKEVESQLERSLRNIRARKGHLFQEQIGQLKAKERFMREENAKLCAKKEALRCSRQNSEVETELFLGLGLPENRLSVWVCHHAYAYGAFYEDMKKDPKEQLRELACFLGFEKGQSVMKTWSPPRWHWLQALLGEVHITTVMKVRVLLLAGMGFGGCVFMPESELLQDVPLLYVCVLGECLNICRGWFLLFASIYLVIPNKSTST
ncbi:hypothetical protein V6N13_086202 [Hibiscus sabdariffa]|uniref:Uncharacterized protein n=1 Tax=Hibiscus sabdariffa TaxID=183260 RepID=A0ABR2FSI4_9ROSI